MTRRTDDFENALFSAFTRDLQFRLWASSSSQEDPAPSAEYRIFKEYREELEAKYLQTGSIHDMGSMWLTPKNRCLMDGFVES